MPRFYTGDELGNVKSIYCSESPDGAWIIESSIVHEAKEADKSKALQKLSVHSSQDGTLLTAARSNGSLSAFSVNAGSSLGVVKEWQEARFKPEHRFVGLDTSERGVYSCTSNGALGLATAPMSIAENLSEAAFHKVALPMRLCDWRLSPNADGFAYGGEEVDLSVWDAERAFATSVQGAQEKKRKRGDTLLPGELWRAKNVPNDGLSLRQPVHITSLTYIQKSSGSQNHLIAGTQLGNVRRYDIRAARRPVADWRAIGKVGGVSTVETGLQEHELFVADHGCNLLALDLRNGRTVYSYKKIAGAITSIAPSGGQLLGSTSRDRFFRLHSTFPPPEQVGQQQEKKGDVLGTFFMKSTPTVVAFDLKDHIPSGAEQRIHGEDEEDVWAAMPVVDEDGPSSGDRAQHQHKARESM